MVWRVKTSIAGRIHKDTDRLRWVSCLHLGFSHWGNGKELGFSGVLIIQISLQLSGVFMNMWGWIVAYWIFQSQTYNDTYSNTVYLKVALQIQYSFIFYYKNRQY